MSEDKALPSVEPPKPTASSKNKNTSISIILVLVVAITGACAGYWLWLEQQSLQAELTRTRQALKDNAAQLTTLRQSNQSNQAALQDINKAFSELQQDIQTSLLNLTQEFASIKGGSRKDWLLAEAEYLLRIANQRVLIEQDMSSGESLLTAAGKVLEEIGDPALMPVRIQLAEDIFALQSAAESKVEQQALELSALSNAALGLEFSPRNLENKAQVIVHENSEADGPLQRLWQKLTAAWSKAIQIRRLDTPFEAPPTPEYSFYLTQNLSLQLEQAKLLLLRQQFDQYAQQLQHTLAWVKHNAPAEHAGVKAIIKRIDALASDVPSTKNVDISTSLAALQKLIEQKYRTHELTKLSNAEEKAEGSAP